MNVRNQMFCYLPKDYLYLNQWLMLKIAFFYNIWKNLNHELKAIKYSKKFKFLIITQIGMLVLKGRYSWKK